jgi:membrane-bound ClpP family serine protease
LYNVLMRGCAIVAFGVIVSYTTAAFVAYGDGRGGRQMPPGATVAAAAAVSVSLMVCAVGWVVRHIVQEELARYRVIAEQQIQEIIGEAIERAERRGMVREASSTTSVLQFGRQRAREE